MQQYELQMFFSKLRCFKNLSYAQAPNIQYIYNTHSPLAHYCVSTVFAHCPSTDTNTCPHQHPSVHITAILPLQLLIYSAPSKNLNLSSRIFLQAFLLARTSFLIFSSSSRSLLFGSTMLSNGSITH